MNSIVFASESVLLILGDSLSASYGMPVENGWPTLLQQRLKQQGYNYMVMNASISGETSSGALARLDNLLLEYQPEVTMIELGGNDGLRGISIKEMQQNLASMIRTIKSTGSEVILTKITLPPNYGPMYIQLFERVFTDLSETYQVALTPFILDFIADKPELMQNDGIHPKAEAQSMILNNLWPTINQVLIEQLKSE